jgi:hypothetical protein
MRFLFGRYALCPVLFFPLLFTETECVMQNPDREIGLFRTDDA